MKQLVFALFSLLLLYSPHAIATPLDSIKLRHVVTASSITIANQVIAQMKADPTHYTLIKKIKGPGGTLRAIVFAATTTSATALQVAWGSQKVSVRVEQPMKAQVYRRGLDGRTESSSNLVSILNMWGPMRILGHLPEAPAAPRSDTGTGTKVCVSDTGINWNHPRLKNRLLPTVVNGVTINTSYDFAWDPWNDPDVWVNYPAYKPSDDRNVFCDAKGVPCSLSNECAAKNFNVNPDGTIVTDADGFIIFNNVPCGYDDDGHGSHVSGTIAAEEIHDGQVNNDIVGIDPTAQLIAAKALGWHWIPNPDFWSVTNPAPDAQPFIYEYFGYPSDLAYSIWYCMEQGAQVINMSWGGGSDDLIEAAISDAAAAGVILVAAAGNNYDPSTKSGPVIYPARHNAVISVSALGLDGEIAPFSSRGSKVDFMAPGVSILSTTLSSAYYGAGNYDYYSGTSMASPHVTGVVSRMLSMAPYADRRDLVGTDIGLARFEQGEHGLINAELSCRQ